MEEKRAALKTSSKVISVIMKIGYSVMTVAMCLSVLTIIFASISGGKGSFEAPWGTNIVLFDGSLPASELIVVCVDILIMTAFLFAIFYIAFRMFRSINVSGEPFTEKNVKSIRAIGILVAAMTIGTGIADSITSIFAETDILDTYTEAPGIVVGVIIFCLSYIIDYGCALKKQTEK